jgi:hypothetical protein
MGIRGGEEEGAKVYKGKGVAKEGDYYVSY